MYSIRLSQIALLNRRFATRLWYASSDLLFLTEWHGEWSPLVSSDAIA